MRQLISPLSLRELADATSSSCVYQLCALPVLAVDIAGNVDVPTRATQ